MMNRRSFHPFSHIALAIFSAMMAPVALPAYAQDAADATTPNCENRSRSWLIRNGLDLSGNAEKPATLALTHAAGDSTFGTADIAVMVDSLCKKTGGRELRYAIGAAYHLNTDKDATSESANVGFSMSYAWKSGGGERILDGGRSMTHWRRIAADASYGRDIEHDSSIQHIGVFYDSTPVGSRNVPDREGARSYSTGLLGGRVMIRTTTPDGGAGRSPPLFSYQFRPGIEYFGGYQPASVPGHLDVTYATLVATAQWQPIFDGKQSPFYVRSTVTGRRKIWGDDAISTTANTISASLGMEMSHTPSESLRQKASVELSYIVGRAPENGFVRDERLQLTFTYLFDRLESHRN